jgi:hypothetical protein
MPATRQRNRKEVLVMLFALGGFVIASPEVGIHGPRGISESMTRFAEPEAPSIVWSALGASHLRAPLGARRSNAEVTPLPPST